MSPMMYSQWFDRLRQNLVSSGFDDVSIDALQADDMAKNKKRGTATTGSSAATEPQAKKPKRTVSSESCATIEKEDESWIDELFQLDAQGNIDDSIVTTSSTCFQAEEDVGSDVVPELSSSIAPVLVERHPLSPQSTPPKQLQQQHSQTAFLSNVVDDVLSELISDEENSLLGEFSQSLLGDDTTANTCGIEKHTQLQADVSSSSSFQQASIPNLEGCLPTLSILLSQACNSTDVLPQPLLPQSAVFDPYPRVPPLQTQPAIKSFSPTDKGVFSVPEGMSDLESTKYTIDSVKNCQEPMLLTLTSFPFRVLYANQAYHDMTGTDSSILGKTFYDTFVNEGEKSPSFGACNGLMLGKHQQDIVRVRSSGSASCTEADDEKNGTGCVYSTVQVSPILKQSSNPESGLRYYAVTLKQLQVQNNTSSIVYLPMPSGSMINF